MVGRICLITDTCQEHVMPYFPFWGHIKAMTNRAEFAETTCRLIYAGYHLYLVLRRKLNNSVLC
jgi:hypothetical protein